MNQPDLGFKVTELRQQRGLTQERLAELCEVSLRTIQRIEGGEVDPRAYTLHCLGEALDFDFGEENTSHENLWLVVLHLSSVFLAILLSLLLWSWKKSQSYKIDTQARQALNFQITMLLVMFAGVLFLLVGLPAIVLLTMHAPGPLPVVWEVLGLASVLPFILVGLFSTYEGVVNALRAVSGKPVHYSLSIPFIR